MSAVDHRQVLDGLLAFYRETYPDRASEIHASTNPVRELFVDSFGIVETVVFVADSYGVDLFTVEFPLEALDTIESLAHLVAQVAASGTRP
ncbi:MAG: acyl carrier protein [Pseudomonadota bacterium]